MTGRGRLPPDLVTPGRAATPGAAALAAAASALVVLVSVWWKAGHQALPDAYTRLGYSDVSSLFGARGLDAGIPWVDAPLEYPPGIGLLAWGVAGVADTSTEFLVVTGLVLAAAAAVATWVLAREVGWPRPLGLLAGPIVLVAAAVNWDLVTVAFVALGLVAHRHGRDRWAGVLLGLGVATKLWPALVLLVVVPAAWRLRGRSAAAGTAIAAAIAWLVLNLPVMVVAFDGWRLFLDTNRERPADWDSLWRLVGTRAGIEPAVSTLNAWVAVLTVVGVVLVMAATVRWLPASRWHEASLPLVVVFLLVGKVWSPQFTLWLLPLFVLAWPGWPAMAALAVADVAVHVTRFHWLANFVAGGLEGAWPEGPFLVAVLVRDLVVVVAVVLWWRRVATGDGPKQPETGNLSRAA